MITRIRNLIIIGACAAAVYFLASYHIVFLNTEYVLLHKSEMNFEYTFVNLNNRDPEDIMYIDTLRDAGIGDVLVEMGLLSEGRAAELQFWYDSQ